MNSRKPKLLMIEPVSDLGGISQYILSTVRYLPRNHYEIHVVASGNGLLFDLLREEGISTHSLRADYSIFTLLLAFFSLRSFLKRENFDLIHAHTAKAGFLCSISNWGLSARIIYTGHGFRFTQKKFRPAKVLFHYFERFICKSSAFTTVLSQTEFDLGSTKGLFRSGKARVVSMSIDANRFSDISIEDAQLQRRRFGIPLNSFVVGMVGRVSSQKDPETFIKAATLLKSEIEEPFFLWVGGGDLEQKVTHAAIRAGLSHRIMITGHQASENIPALLSVIDVLLFTSRFEGLPIALLEAMAAKKLIVAANVGSIQDVIQDGITGWLFKPGDHIKAAQLVKTIHETRSTLDNVRRASLDLIIKKYSPKEKMAREFQSVYKEAMR